MRDAGYGDTDVSEALEVRAAMEAVRRGGDLAAAQAIVDRYADRPWFPLANVRRTLDRSPWRDMDFDPAPVIAKVRCPTLLFYGEDDEWTPVEASIAAWKSNPHATIVRLAGTRHAPTVDGAISPEYTRVLAELLRDLPEVPVRVREGGGPDAPGTVDRPEHELGPALGE